MRAATAHTPQVTGLNVAAVVLTSPATDVSVQSNVTLSAVNQYAGLILRDTSATNNYYVGRVQQTTVGTTPAIVAAIYRYYNGSIAQIGISQTIANASLAIGSSDALVFQAEGNSLKLFVNGTLAAYGQDSVLTSGTVGMYTYGAPNGVTIESGFSAYAFTPTQSLTFLDSFNAPTLGNQLDPTSWEEHAGNFNIASGKAVSQATGANIGVVTLANPASDVSVNASVSLSVVNQVAGLIARSSTSGTSYYVGRIQQISGTSVLAAIYKYLNGVPTLMGARKPSAPAST